MRTLDLIRVFSDDELEEIKRLIVKSDKPRQLSLFTELEKAKTKEAEPDNAALYKKVFGKKYTKQQDYQIRHELRVLNETFYAYLAEETARLHIHDKKDLFNYWLARGYYDRRMHNFFRNAIDGYITEASIKKTDTAGSISLPVSTTLLSMKSRWLIDNQAALPENILMQAEALEQCIKEEKKQFLYRLRELESRQAFLVYLDDGFVGNKTGIPLDRRTVRNSVIDFTDIERDDIFLRYTELQKNSYETRNEPRIKVLKESLELTETAEGRQMLGINTRLQILYQLGLELLMMGRYKEADDYMAYYVAERGEHQGSTFPHVIHNYINCKLNLGQYQQGIEIYAQYKTLLESNVTRYMSRVLLAYCHLLLGDDDKALKIAPKETDLPMSIYLGNRFIYTISYLMREEYALAVYEIKNLRRTVKAVKTGNIAGMLEIIELYLRYAGAHTKRKEDKGKLLGALRNEIKSNSAYWNVRANSSIQVRWLMTKL